MVPLSTASKPTLDNVNTSPITLHGQERLPGYAHLIIHRAHKICSNDDLLQKEIHNIQTFMSWNGFPRLFIPASISKRPNT